MKKLLFALISTAFIGQTFADECRVDVTGNDQMQYNVKEITVPKSCAEFTLNLENIGKLPRAAMGHNVVISTTADKTGVSTDGIGAGLDNQYVKPEDSRVIAMTDIVGGGEKTSVTFKTDNLTAGEDYSFYCTFPGHVAIMSGKVIVK